MELHLMKRQVNNFACNCVISEAYCKVGASPTGHPQSYYLRRKDPVQGLTAGWGVPDRGSQRLSTSRALRLIVAENRQITPGLPAARV